MKKTGVSCTGIDNIFLVKKPKKEKQKIEEKERERKGRKKAAA